MGKRIDPSDLIGKRFSHLEVLEAVGIVKGKQSYKCRCDCGNEKIIDRYSLLYGEAKSCSCKLNKLENENDIIGMRFGRLKVIEYVGQLEQKNGLRLSSYRCKCECGNECIVLRNDLLQKTRVNCGHCYRVIDEGDHCKYITPSGDYFLFDKVDRDMILEKRWCINSYGYPSTKDENGRSNIVLSRLLLNAGENEIVDHINGDTRDNRRNNLRIAMRGQNQYNMKISKSNTTGYKGVTYLKGKHKYKAQLRHRGKNYHLGHFNTAEEAALAYDKAARFYFGEFACVNFPGPGEQGCRRNQKEELPTAVSVPA